jgi:2,3-bisphosphoglycerate-independent phosphoglycerate mutase
MLVILDGWGWREEEKDNAVRLARTPNFDRLWSSEPTAFLRTSGLDVGLPEGQMGNSEVGHLNIGAGRVVLQDLPRINAAIADGSIEKLLDETGLPRELTGSGGTCHLLGLVSDGGVHSHLDHAVALARIITRRGIRVVCHVFTDGRDTPPGAAADQVRAFEQALPAGARIGTVCGRYYAMDRDKRWERVRAAFDAMVHGKASHYPDAPSAIAAAYESGKTDEFIPAAVIGDYAGMRDGDGILCFNFRADRVRQILDALLEPSFDGFDRSAMPRISAAVGMTAYSDKLSARMGTIFEAQNLALGLGEVVANAGLKQLRMAETEKFPHVTYFLNGGREDVYLGEDRILVPSPKVATYDLQPEMSAPELTERAVAAIRSKAYDLIVLNFANPDMVGHTGSLEAAVKAVETVDTCLGAIADTILAIGGSLLVTADHGNCEMMRDPQTGEPHTYHTTFPVPVLLVGGDDKYRLHDGRLADIAPTLLQLMGLEQPAAMSGKSLLESSAAS